MPELPESITSPFTQPTGARRINLQMRAMLDRANQFKGLPPGTAKPLTWSYPVSVDGMLLRSLRLRWPCLPRKRWVRDRRCRNGGVRGCSNLRCS